MLKFLANENISPLTVEFIRNLGFDIKSVKEAGLKGAADEKIVEFAIFDKRTILTIDLDYGEIYYFASVAKLSIIVLRLRSQWYENVNFEIGKLLKTGKLETEEFKNALIILSEGRYRIHKKT